MRLSVDPVKGALNARGPVKEDLKGEEDGSSDRGLNVPNSLIHECHGSVRKQTEDKPFGPRSRSLPKRRPWARRFQRQATVPGTPSTFNPGWLPPARDR